MTPGGTLYGKSRAYHHGRRHGQPLRRAQADHARGQQRRDHHGFLAVRRVSGGLPQGRVRHQKGTRGGFPRHRRQPCGEPDGRTVRVPVAGRCAGVVHRSRRARKALGHGARRARLPARDRRPLRRHQRRRFLRRGGVPRAVCVPCRAYGGERKRHGRLPYTQYRYRKRLCCARRMRNGKRLSHLDHRADAHRKARRPRRLHDRRRELHRAPRRHARIHELLGLPEADDARVRREIR